MLSRIRKWWCSISQRYTRNHYQIRIVSPPPPLAATTLIVSCFQRFHFFLHPFITKFRIIMHRNQSQNQLIFPQICIGIWWIVTFDRVIFKVWNLGVRKIKESRRPSTWKLPWTLLFLLTRWDWADLVLKLLLLYRIWFNGRFRTRLCCYLKI